MPRSDPEQNRTYMRLYMRKYSKLHPRDDRATRKQRKQQAREFVLDAKANPCTDCGGTFPQECMDFDHVRGHKHHEISFLMNRGATLPKIAREIAKCDLVCANCHRIRTATRIRARIARGENINLKAFTQYTTYPDQISMEFS